jgi:hypothetical protein
MQRALKTSVNNNNRLKSEDMPVHNWYRFVLSFPPHLVREYIEKFKLNSKMTVLDPFCGTGTTLVECKKLGIPAVGIEANPVAFFASSTKLNWQPDPDGLFKHAKNIAKIANMKLGAMGFMDDNDLPLFEKIERSQFNFRTLPQKSAKLLLGDSISPIPLHKTLELIIAIENNRDNNYYNHERLALSKALVYDISNLHFGPEVGVRKNKKKDAPVITAWLNRVKDIAEDLRNLNQRSDVYSRVISGDSRKISSLLAPNSIDAVITSPPYPNEKDYSRTTRLESVLLGFISDIGELRSMKKAFIRSNTRSVYKDDSDNEFISENDQIKKIAEEIEQKRIELGKTSGFERLYGRVTELYFGGMAKHLMELRGILKPNARLAYVVGDQASYLRIMIRTGKLLAGIAASLGYEVLGIDLFRTRIATATKAQLREEIVLLKWKG